MLRTCACRNPACFVCVGDPARFEPLFGGGDRAQFCKGKEFNGLSISPPQIRRSSTRDSAPDRVNLVVLLLFNVRHAGRSQAAMHIVSAFVTVR